MNGEEVAKPVAVLIKRELSSLDHPEFTGPL